MLKSFQKGGAATPKEEQQSPVELIYVLHNLIKETKDQPKSGSKEDIIEFISEHDAESEMLSEEFKTKVSTPEGVEELQSDAEFMAFYNQLIPSEETKAQYAAKGAKLKKLKAQSGMSIPKRESALAKKEPTGQDALKAAAKLNAAKKAVVPTKEVVENVRVPNKGRDIGQIGGNTHNEQVTVTKKVLNKAEGGKVEPRPKPTVLSGPTIIGKKKPVTVKKSEKSTEKYATSTPIKSRTDLVGPAGKEVFQNTGKYKTEVLKNKKGGEVTPKVKLIKKGSSKKCACGCDLILSKAEGGKVIETCSCKCGGKIKKKK